MGIFAEEIVTTDKLGRRTGPRTQHTIEEKLRIVEETRVRGTVVPIERAPRTVASQSSAEPKQTSRLIEIRLSNGHSIVLHGRVDAAALSRVIDLLVRR